MIQNNSHSIHLNTATLLNTVSVSAQTFAEQAALHMDFDSTQCAGKTAEHNTYTTYTPHPFLEAYSLS